MASINSLAAKLTLDYPDITFSEGTLFKWLPEEQVITYNASSNDSASLLHELSHALLGHQQYTRDITLLEMERDAWQQATQIASKYNVTVPSEQIEDALDTYRDWLHARSTCPSCSATGVELRKKVYSCLACTEKWTVNEARTCGLKRYTLK